MVAQVKGAEHLPDTQHVALCYMLKGPRILVVLLHFSLFLVHGFQALSAQYLEKKKAKAKKISLMIFVNCNKGCVQSKLRKGSNDMAMLSDSYVFIANGSPHSKSHIFLKCHHRYNKTQFFISPWQGMVTFLPLLSECAPPPPAPPFLPPPRLDGHSGQVSHSGQ